LDWLEKLFIFLGEWLSLTSVYLESDGEF